MRTTINPRAIIPTKDGGAKESFQANVIPLRGDVKIQTLAIANFAKVFQTFPTFPTTGIPTLSQAWQPLASSDKPTPFSRYCSNDILISLIAH